MRYKRFAFLFFCNMIPLFIGMGLFPLLPLYDAQFGATPTSVGIHYAAMYVASLIGIMSVDWLSRRLSPRTAFIIGAIIGLPALMLLAVANALWQVILLTSAIWFCGGITLTLLSVFTGQLATDNSRGKAFSLMMIAYPLSGIVGGTTVGQLVEHYSYTVMFLVLAGVWTALPLAGIFGLRDVQAQRRAPTTGAPAGGSFGITFYLLLLTTLLGALAVNSSRLGTSLSMQALAFDAAAVASTAVVSGFVTIPVVLLVGVLSDRFGQRPFLLASYALAAVAAIVLLTSTALWHFWIASTLLSISWCTNRSTAAALAIEALDPSELNRGMPRINAMDSVASIIGFAGTGVLIDLLGAAAPYLVAFVLAGSAIPVLLAIRPRRQSSIAGIWSSFVRSHNTRPSTHTTS